ncbi:MAG TPA: MMPL family transporter [Kofleriaceae bacterium]|nr:MMPL family transporter [Kofleriaceae bacterium]
MIDWRRRIATIAVVVATAVGFALALPHLRFTTQITEFLPDDASNRGAQIAALIADTELARVMILDVSGAHAADKARDLLAFLRGQPDVAVARSGVTEADIEATLAFLRSWPATTFVPRDAYGDDAIRARLTALRDQLASPAGAIVRDAATGDPLGGVWQPLDMLRGAAGDALVDDGGVLVTADRAHAFVFVETRSSPFDSDAQRAFRAVLDGWVARAAPVRLQTAGTAQFAIASEAQMKGDVNRIGGVSTVGILVVFLVLFGSIRLIAIGFVPMLFGSAVAVLACQAWFGSIHGITIAFGTSLLGVGLDYVEHYYAHFVLSPELPAATTMRRVAPSLVFGALTTIIGFVGIAASGLPGLRQMAVFSVVAIVASMAATYWIVPAWMPARYRPPRTLARVNRAVLGLLVRLTRTAWGRGGRWLAAGVAVVGAIAALATAEFSDNVNMLVDDAGPHVAEDRAVRARIGQADHTFAVVTAASDDALLEDVARVSAALARARAAGLLTSFVAIDQLAPSAREQGARLAAARAAAPRIRAIMTELDFVPDQFAPFWAAISGPAPAPRVLTLGDLRRSPLALLVAAWLPAQASPVALIPLTGVGDPAALQAAVPGATILAPSETIVSLFRGVRIRTVVASLIGFVAIFVLLCVRYRSPRKTLIALGPALLACLTTVGALVVLGAALTILHVMSLLLVVSMGVDFGIFFVDSADSLEEAARTMVSILTAAVTTILSFGLLGLSASPGLAAIGITVTLGVSFSLVWCLVIASLAGAPEKP